MPDLNDVLGGGPAGFFFANDPQGASAQAMRQRIALAMMAKKRNVPKNLGEGIFSVGESIGDALMSKDAIAQTAQEAAQTDKNIQDMQRGVTPGAISDSAVPGGGAQTATAMPPGGNVPSWTQFAQEESPGGLGLAPPQAAGLVANLQAESGAGINPNPTPGDAGTAFGAGQWRGPRFEALKQRSAAQGIDPMTTPAQQGFMRQEMIGEGNKTPTYGNAYAALATTKTPAAAATAVDQLYEQSAGRSRGGRIANAEGLMAGMTNPRDRVAALTVGGTAPTAYAPTAMAPAGNVTSDMPPVTGAPPAGPQVAQAPQDPRAAIQKAPDEYVPRDRPVPPPPVKPQGMGPIESRPDIQRALYGDVDPRQKAVAQAMVAREQSDRNAAYDNELKMWEPNKAAWQKEQELELQYKMSRQEKALDIKEKQRKLAKPDLEDIEGKFERDPVTGKWRQPQTETPQDPNAMPQVKMSKEQADNLTFYGWAGKAHKNLQGKDQLLAHGLSQELLGKVPVFGNQLQEAEYRRARNAANSFVLAFMRDTSGAAYGAKEMYDHASAFLPKQGDDQKTLDDKAAARERFVQGKYAGLGQGGQRVAQWQDAQDTAKDQTAAAKSITDVGRPGRRIGETVTSNKTGKQRVWDGKQWQDL